MSRGTHGGELAAFRALDEVQEQGAPSSLVLELPACTSFYVQTSMDGLLSPRGFYAAYLYTFALCGCCVSCTVRVRCVKIGFYATLWYTIAGTVVQ